MPATCLLQTRGTNVSFLLHLWYKSLMATDRRIDRITSVLAHRQPDLRVVLEGVTIAHNASAVIRTCDAAGILYLDLISPNPELIVFNEAITTRTDKWLEIGIHSSATEFLSELKAKGFAIAVTRLTDEAVPYVSLDYTRPTALVFGSESDGISDEALALADHVIRIPMVGMVQSLNLSVSVAVVLYEAFRQREAAGIFAKPRLSPAELEDLKARWLHAK
jgi:tRNA (guanosine-2'-O-)-methyltransferase